MNIWIIVGIIAGVFIIGGFAIGTFVTADAQQEESQVISYSTCGNSCTAEGNCGLTNCGAVSSGSCGCGN